MSETSTPRRRFQTGRAGQLLLAAIILIPALIYGGFWVHERLTHVDTLDARIEGNVITLSSRVPGWITRLDLVQGDRVRAGEVLAELDSREARLRLAALDARKAAAQAELDELETRVELASGQTRSRVQAAQARQNALEAGQAAAKARLAQAEREYARLEPMARDNLVPEQQLDRAADALDEAREELRRAQAQLRAAGAELEEARANELEPEMLRRRQRVLAARLRELEAEYDRQALEIDDRVIRAPVDGVVDIVFADVGEFVGAGQNLLMLHTPGEVWVEARIKETQLAPVRVGQPVRLRVDAFPDRRYTGRVERIVSAATNQFALLPNPNPSGNFTKITQRIPVRIAIDEPDERLAPGMMVRVYIDIRDR